MASTSYAAAVTNTPTNSCYDIFLSHRGPYTKNTFASYLYRSLVSHGFRVFLDKEELLAGDTLTSQIETAIKSASVHVAIFSPGYAKSEWCLNELLMMVESEAPIIPVFYHVQPTEVRRTKGKGVYAEALRFLEEKKGSDGQPRYNSTTVQNWRGALSTAAEISGLELERFNGNEVELLDKVVESVLKKLNKTRFDVGEYPTGLNEMIKDFENRFLLQQQSSKPQVIGIVGLGGIGKTTLVQELYNRKSSHYQRSCFLFDVREKSKSSLESLQKKLLLSLSPKADEQIGSVSEGTQKLRSCVSCVPPCRALVVLDDVDHADQLDALLRPIRDVLHSDSLILITSRDRGVLIRSKVEMSSIYKLTGLNPHHSKELFCLHAFTHRHPLPGFEDLVDKYLKACNGLPLSLKVFGALLYGNHDSSFWKDHLQRLEQILPHDIRKRLEISYHALQRDEKEIFLDLACFFIGENMDTAIRIWEGSGWKGSLVFQTLQNKNLVEVVGTENEIRMHDHLRDLGRDLAEEQGLPRRIWRTEHIDDLLQRSSEVTEVRGISCFSSLPMPERRRSSRRSLKISVRGKCMGSTEYEDRYKMKNLQLLVIDSTEDLESIVNAVQLPNLIWLRWKTCGLSSLPSWIPLEKLRVLQVSGKHLKKLWRKESQAPLQLRELKIHAPLRHIPKSIGLLKHLEWISLTLGDSNKMANLEKLPEEFFQLCSLKHMNICCRIRSLPESLGNLTNLQHIDLSHCMELESLPESLGNLTRLEYLNLTYCTKLTMSGETLGELRSLKKLSLTCMLEFKCLPDSLGWLTQLTKLKVCSCRGLVEIGVLPDALITLYLRDCRALKKIKGICSLTKLQKLHIQFCGKLEKLPSIETLVALEVLNAFGCKKLRSMSGLASLTKLRIINVTHCKQLKELEGVEQLTSLQRLNVHGCCNLQLREGVDPRCIKGELSISEL